MIAALFIVCTLLLVLGVPVAFALGGGTLAAILASGNLSLLAYFIAPSMFKFDPSGRILARELQMRNIPLNKLAVGWMSRGQHYSLNFYLHEEITDWNQENLAKEYVVTDMPLCRNLSPVPFACEPMPFNEHATGAYLYHILMPGSPQRLGDSGGQAQKKE